jgi:hypothetical protein
VAALVPGSTAPKRRRRRQWPALLIAEVRRLRTLHPNLVHQNHQCNMYWPDTGT